MLFPRPAMKERGEGLLLRLVSVLRTSSPRPSPPLGVEEREFAALVGVPDYNFQVRVEKG